MKEIRLDKFLCQCLGISRKGAKDMIRKKQITVNGQQASRPEIKVFPGRIRCIVRRKRFPMKSIII